MRRRDFSRWTLGLLGASALPRGARAAPADADECDLPAPIAKLTPMTAGIAKISDDERRRHHDDVPLETLTIRHSDELVVVVLSTVATGFSDWIAALRF